jgi:hypothetical protein
MPPRVAAMVPLDVPNIMSFFTMLAICVDLPQKKAKEPHFGGSNAVSDDCFLVYVCHTFLAGAYR